MNRLLAVTLLVLAPMAALAAVPSPEEFFGFRIGADKKLARWDKIVEYLQAVGAASNRVHVRDLGPTTLNNPFLAVEVSSAETMSKLDYYKGLERKLYFQGGAPADAERDEIFGSGKAVVVITNSVHANEIGATQMVTELVYRMATDDSPRMRKILENTILVLVPCSNPDGEIMITDWYNKYLGTKYEASPLPFLYHHYTGHDNNRDMYVFSQRESQMTAKLLWHDWFPGIWLDEHQQGSAGARIFTMPARDPINPNVHPLVYRLNGIYGQSQAAALEAEGRGGIIYNSTYTNFWQGALAWAGWWHNEVGLLTEVASARIATPLEQKKADPGKADAAAATASTRDNMEEERRRQLEHPEEPIPAPRDITPRTEYPQPWLGGTWHLRDIVDYELTATFGLLEQAADTRETLLRQIYEMNRATLEEGKKGEIGGGKDKVFAVLIPPAQHDSNEVAQLIDKLLQGGVQIDQANGAFTAGKESYAAGTYVIPMTQVFARYAKDLLEKQTYPEVRRAPNAPAEAPYDVSAWSLGMQFGVKVAFANAALPADLKLTPVPAAPKPELFTGQQAFLYNGATGVVVINRLLKEGVHVTISSDRVEALNASADAWAKATAGFVLKPLPPGHASRAAVALRAPKIAIYQSFSPSMDEGWTRFVLDQYGFSYTPIHNADIQAGGLKAKYDAIILPDQKAKDILEGLDFDSIVPDYRGGLGEKGWGALVEFTREGGTLIALGEACNLLVDKMPLPVKELKRTTNREQHFAPGTILNLQVDTRNPIGFGMPETTWGYYLNSPFFQLTEGFSSQKVSVVARYPNSQANASGWLRGEDLMLGRAAVVSIDLEPGRVVLFGIRPQHRAQSHATYPLLFNALYWSATN